MMTVTDKHTNSNRYLTQGATPPNDRDYTIQEKYGGNTFPA